jgi:hypothetical protein
MACDQPRANRKGRRVALLSFWYRLAVSHFCRSPECDGAEPGLRCAEAINTAKRTKLLIENPDDWLVAPG